MVLFRAGICGESTRACLETMAQVAPPIFPAALPDAGGPPALPVHRAGVAKKFPFCHKCRCDTAREVLFSASATAKCRIPSLRRHAPGLAAHNTSRPVAAESRKPHPRDTPP